MRPLRKFEEFIREGIVKKQSPDLSRTEFLVKESEKAYSFLKKMIKEFPIDNENSNTIIKLCYDVIMELIRAKMLKKGLNAAGKGAHEAEVSYLRNLDFPETDAQFANQLRFFRNGMIYYGKILDAEYAKSVFEFLNKIYEKLVD